MILLTGFEPFASSDFNPSIVIARHAEKILREQGHEAVAAELPCVFAQAPRLLHELITLHRPQVVLSLGLAQGREKLGMEKVAINLIDARIADNAGARPIDVPVLADGPAAYFSTLPLKAALQELGSENVEISYSAGTYVCNQVFYSLMHQSRTDPEIRAGFIHVPWVAAHDAQLLVHARAVAQIAVLALAGANEPRLSAGKED
ncbi:pyroglutamyl-peptidase I [Paeniglutamicibacter sp. Y32M11]|uniref:pyroglutamyl-peptidase I family protein n=1 Tax=Paeniglutamicibacter sp. Y32M11 TaxID=2853258 RepID=UPI001C52F758|nr:pyroglutamyl-peptidase I [Paeniglutamicibacter sp. Y32M11]QXQ11391.1 pyroglutamyl-peptidase I [Paeniglutamicibacter sp. Y32M11]